MLIAKANLENSIEIFKRASLKSEPVVFSTDTIYGLGAPLHDKLANEKIFDIKGRDRSKPFPVLIADLEQLSGIAVIEDVTQQKIIDKVWPGPVTLIMKAKNGLDQLYTVNGTIAVRMPDKKWLRELIMQTGVVSATSANPAGEDYINDEHHICKLFNKKVEFFFLFDKNIQSASSTIVNISKAIPVIIRDGKYSPIIKEITSQT